MIKSQTANDALISFKFSNENVNGEWARVIADLGSQINLIKKSSLKSENVKLFHHSISEAEINEKDDTAFKVKKFEKKKVNSLNSIS
jgi:hypothetical protein